MEVHISIANRDGEVIFNSRVPSIELAEEELGRAERYLKRKYAQEQVETLSDF